MKNFILLISALFILVSCGKPQEQQSLTIPKVSPVKFELKGEESLFANDLLLKKDFKETDLLKKFLTAKEMDELSLIRLNTNLAIECEKSECVVTQK